MSVQIDPNQLRYIANRFSSGAQELCQKARRLESCMNELIQSSWKGQGAHAYAIKCESLIYEIQKSADVLESAISVLHRLAERMDRVIQLRQQAHMLEQQSYAYSGDSIDELHYRQHLMRQVADLRQQADWEANSADSQAAVEFSSIIVMIPLINDLMNQFVGEHATSRELDDIPEPMKSFLLQHQDLLLNLDTGSGVESIGPDTKIILNGVAQRDTVDSSIPSFWDQTDAFMSGGVDGSKEFVFGLLSSISHPIDTFQELKYEVANPQVIVERLLGIGKEIKDDWQQGNWYGFNKTVTGLIWGVLLGKKLGLSEDAAENVANATKSKAAALGSLLIPSSKVVLPDGTVIRVADKILKENEEFTDYQEARHINEHLKGGQHPKTEVPFDEKGFPVFRSYFDVKLPEEMYLKRDAKQFEYANLQLNNAIQKDSSLGKQFTSEQLQQIDEGITPKGYTWHHNETEGLLQLVTKEIHKQTGHTGGRSIWGGGSSKR